MGRLGAAYDEVTDRMKIADGVRAYDYAAATRTATAVTAATVALGALGTKRELMLTATERCFVRFGTAAVAAAVSTDPDVLPIEPGEKFHQILGETVTHMSVIRDTADGVLRSYPCL